MCFAPELARKSNGDQSVKRRECSGGKSGVSLNFPIVAQQFRLKFRTGFSPNPTNSTSQHISEHLFVQDAVGRQAGSSSLQPRGRPVQAEKTA
jgi:hypothetical protein